MIVQAKVIGKHFKVNSACMLPNMPLLGDAQVAVYPGCKLTSAPFSGAEGACTVVDIRKDKISASTPTPTPYKQARALPHEHVRCPVLTKTPSWTSRWAAPQSYPSSPPTKSSGRVNKSRCPALTASNGLTARSKCAVHAPKARA